MWKRLRKIWKDPVWSKIIATALAAAVIAAYGWISGYTTILLHWSSASVDIPRWAVPALVGLGIMVSVTWLGWRSIQRRSGAFSPIVIGDAALPIEWHIKRDPAKWIDDHKMPDHGYRYHEELLAGPYHAITGCNALLKTQWPSYSALRNQGPYLMTHCPVCGKIAFNINYENEYPLIWEVRAQALAEIQRLARLGKRIKSGLRMENPEYWKGMPPHPTRESV